MVIKQMVLLLLQKNKSYQLIFCVCKPDNLCKKIKNPVQYAKIKARNAND
jgi:DNA primase large subunit